MKVLRTPFLKDVVFGSERGFLRRLGFSVLGKCVAALVA